MVVATVPNGGNKKCKYHETDNSGTKVVDSDALDRSLVIDSYWSKGESPDVVRTISLDHIIEINA